MCFKKNKTLKLAAVITFITALVITLACSNEEKKSSSLSISLAFDSTCTDGMSQRLRSWASGQGDSEVIQADVTCISDAVDYFIKRVRGLDAESYSRVEVYNIIQKFFDLKAFDQETVDYLLEVKSWILGGSKFLITKEELNQMVVFFESIKPILGDLSPHAEKLFFGMVQQAGVYSQFSAEDATMLRSNLNALLEQISEVSVLPVTAIDLDRLYAIQFKLAKKFNFTPVDKAHLETYWSIVNTLLGQEREGSIRLAPESKIYSYIEKIYFWGIRFKYGVLQTEISKPIGFTHLEPIVEEFLPFLNEVVNNQEDKKITKPQVADFLKVVVNASLEEGMDESIQSFIVDRVFSHIFKAQGDGIYESDLNILRTEWDEFRNFQNNTEVLHGQRFAGSFVKPNTLASLSQTNREAIDFLWPVISNDKGYVLTDLKPRYIEANYSNLFRINWQRAAGRLLIKMYAGEPFRSKNLVGLDINEVQQAYYDVFKVLNAFDILDDDSQESWFRIFNEGNLFVPRANPDAYFSYPESVDFFALLFSAFSFSSYLKEDLEADCRGDKACEIDWIKNSPKDYWKDLIPEFGNYLKSLDTNSSEWRDWLNGMEEVARGGGTSPESFSSADLLAFILASEYIEIFLRKFDKNSDQVINFEESFHSFASFKAALLLLPQIQGTAAENDMQTLFAVYTFFLKKGRMPKEIFGQPIELLGWLGKVKICTKKDSQGQLSLTGQSGACSFISKRSKLMKILAFLTNAI